VVPGGGSHVGEGEGISHRPATRDAEPGRGDEDHPVQVHPVAVLQPPGEPCHAGGAIAFPLEVLGRCPAPVPGDEGIDPARQVSDVLVHPEELLPVRISHDAGEAGVHRIHVDDVGDVEDGVLVVDDPVRLHREALVVDGQEARAGVADVHPDRGRARSAVEGEDERTPRAVPHVGTLVVDVEDRGDGLPVIIPDRLRPGRGRIGNTLALDGDRVAGGDGRVRHHLDTRGPGCVRLLGGERRGGEK